jgi:hypothetical protein
MKHGGKMLACVVGGLAVCASAHALPVNSSENSDNPYQSIVDRNVFSLKPPPPPADPSEINKPTAVKITLTGITTILGNKRVLMKTAPPPGKPGEGPKTDQSYILTEGQREGDIEVLEIDEKTGSVKVNNGGTVQTLTFEKDGAKLPATAAPAGPGVPGAQIPGLPVAHPASLPAVPGATTPSFQLPTRVPRLPTTANPAGTAFPTAAGFNSSGTGITPSYGAAAASVPGAVGLPGASVPTLQPGSMPGSTTTTPLPNANSKYSAEEIAIMIEAERQAGGPNAALLPPTPLTPRLNQQQQPGTANSQPTVNLPPLPGRPGPY